MKINKMAPRILFASLCAVAIFVGIWGFLTGGGVLVALGAAVILLVAAQLLLIFILTDNKPDEDRTLGLEEIYSRLDDIDRHVEQLNQLRMTPDQPALAEPVATSVPELPKPTSPEPLHVRHSAPAFAPVPEPITDTETVKLPDYLDDQRLSLYLEPVVELETMKTAFYRAELVYKTDQLEKIRIIDMAKGLADKNYSALMDMKLFNRLGPVIERLAEKGRVASVICPMSEHSFSNPSFLEELTIYLKHHPELARVLVIEVSQSNLAGLSQDGMAGLAFLAQIGATFCLGGAGLESPDLASLSSLGFRYLDLDYDDNIERYSLQSFGTTGPAVSLRNQASKAGISLIGSGFIRKNQYNALNHIIKFGRGRAFSIPRLVRSDIASPAEQYKAA